MKLDIIRAWKDETYRQNLSDEQLRMLPENPAGELTDADLQSVSGGFDSFDSSFDGGFFFRGEQEFHNSQALACQNPIFSNTNIRGANAANILSAPMCAYFG